MSSIIDDFRKHLLTPKLGIVGLFIKGVDSTGALEGGSTLTLSNGNAESVVGTFNITTSEIKFWIRDPLFFFGSYSFDGYAWFDSTYGIIMAGTVNLIHTIFVPIVGANGQTFSLPQNVVVGTFGWFAGPFPFLSN